MISKFAGIDAIPGDGYLLNFVVDGEDKNIFCQGIEELMSTVLTEDEFNNWLDRSELPVFNNKHTNDEVEFAEWRLEIMGEHFAFCFE